MKKLAKPSQYGITQNSFMPSYYLGKGSSPRTSSKTFSHKNHKPTLSQYAGKIQHIRDSINVEQKRRNSDQSKEKMHSQPSAKHLESSGQKLHGTPSSPSLRTIDEKIKLLPSKKQIPGSHFSSKYDISSLFTSRKLTLKSSPRTYSQRHTIRSNSEDRERNLSLMSTQNNANEQIKQAKKSEEQNKLITWEKKEQRQAQSLLAKHTKNSKTTLYLQYSQEIGIVEPQTPTFQDPLQIPNGSSNPSSPHQNSGVVKLITSLDLQKRNMGMSCNFATEPHSKAITTERQFSPISIDTIKCLNTGASRSTLYLQQNSNQASDTQSRLKPILEKQDLNEGDRALSAIHSNESFDVENKETHVYKMKQHLHSREAKSTFSKDLAKKEGLASNRSKKKIISVTVTPACNLDSRKSLQFLHSPLTGSVKNVLKSLERKAQLKKTTTPYSNMRNSITHMSPKYLNDTKLNSGVTSPLVDSRNLSRQSEAVPDGSQSVRYMQSELTETLKEIVKRNQHSYNSSIDMRIGKNKKCLRKQLEIELRSSKSKNRTSLQGRQLLYDVTSTMDTSYQAQNSSLTQRIKSKDEVKKNGASQFDQLAQKLKRQLLSSYSGNHNQTSLPTTPKSESKKISSSFQYPIPSKSPQQIRRKTIHNNLEKVPETARPTYQSDSNGFKNKQFYKAIVHSGFVSKERRNNMYTSPKFHSSSHSQSKLSHAKASLTDSRSPSSTLLNQQQDALNKVNIKTPSPLYKRPNNAPDSSHNKDELACIKERVSVLLSQYNHKFIKMQQEIHTLREENETLRNYVRVKQGDVSLSPSPFGDDLNNQGYIRNKPTLAIGLHRTDPESMVNLQESEQQQLTERLSHKKTSMLEDDSLEYHY